MQYFTYKIQSEPCSLGTADRLIPYSVELLEYFLLFIIGYSTPVV